LVLVRQFFLALEQIDEQIVREAAKEGCMWCGGPLYRSDYDRKPRGGLIAVAGEAFRRRFSLCCGKEGCRRRAMPPSVRFLGRRVYLGAAVLVASALAVLLPGVAAVQQATAIPARTVRRWRTWWRRDFTVSRVFVALAGRVMPPLETAALPLSLLDRLPGTATARLEAALRLLSPLTTRSPTTCAAPDLSRFLRSG
jgi:hypothetical protein